MKKIQLWFLFLLLSASGAFAQSCVVDTSNYDLFSPAADHLPCVIRDSMYDITLQLYCPPGLAGFNIDSITVSSFPNLPTGITRLAPASSTMYPNGRMCIRISGTTTDTTGYYEILYNGVVYLHGVGNPPFSYLRQNYPGAIPDYYLYVINAGDACPNTQSTGLLKQNRVLSNAFTIYPNPNNGVFEFELNAPEKGVGEINIHDLTGRLLYSQKTSPAFYYKTTIDVSRFNAGIYLVEYRTAEGYAVKKITIE